MKNNKEKILLTLAAFTFCAVCYCFSKGEALGELLALKY